MIYVTRKVHFNAAHKMYNPDWSPEKNQLVFGPCSNENWHGHNYELEVTIAGIPDPDTGYVIDLKQLHQIIDQKILQVCDHKNLNLDVPFMKGKLASTENFAISIWNELAPAFPDPAQARLFSVRLYETERNYVEYRGELFS